MSQTSSQPANWIFFNLVCVHGGGLEVHEHSAGHVLASLSLIGVDIDPLELKVAGTLVASSGVDALFVTSES